MDLTEFYWLFHSTVGKGIFFSSVYGLLFCIDHLLGYNKFINKKALCILSTSNGINLEISSK